MIRVLLVDDSLCAQYLLKRVLESDPDIQVIGTAQSGRMAVKMAKQLKPDVISMDLRMPGMDGLACTREIMSDNPIPILIVSSDLGREEAMRACDFLGAGAIAAMEKPSVTGGSHYENLCAQLIKSVKCVSGIKLVRRIQSIGHRPAVSLPKSKPAVIAIGASTGGPPILRQIFGAIRNDSIPPIMVVQHMAEGFLEGLMSWLQSGTDVLRVCIAEHGTALQPGTVYFGPDAKQMGISADRRIILSDAAPEHLVRPSVSYLFKSVARSCGSQSVGILLTGMGADGSAELGLMKKAGAITVAQLPASCVVDGMPGTAISLDAAVRVLDPQQIIDFLNGLTADNSTESRLPASSTSRTIG